MWVDQRFQLNSNSLEKIIMRILVIDGQGGGIGRSLVELLVKNFPDAEVGATGTNSIATETMLKGGPSFAATGENAILFNAAEADVIIGPAGIIMANALHGEISPAIAMAVSSSKAKVVLIPMNHCRAYIAGVEEKKVAEYVSKDYPVEKMLELVLRPWKQAITKYFRDITEQELHNPTEKFDESDLEDLNFRNNVLQPYFKKQGLQEVKVWKPNETRSDIRIEYQGYQLKYTDDIFFYPNAHYPIYCTNRVPRYSSMQGTPLRALADYLRKMPEITRKTDEVVIKVMHFYDGLMQQKNEKYCKNVEFLDSLAAQHKGTPVGKMMKFLRWNAGRFSNSESKGYEFSIPMIKVLGETAFSFVVKDVPQGYSVVNGQLTGTYKDEVKERWLDADCQNVYVADPVTTDFDEWVKTHRRWSWSVQEFLSGYSPQDSKRCLSIDFIEQKL